MADLKSYLATAATAVALATSPAYGADKLPLAQSDNVTAQTRQKVADLKLEFPNFKLSTDAQQCIDGKLIDLECEPTINDEVDIYQKKQQVNAERQQVNAERQQVNAERQQLVVVEEARNNIAIVIWLIQLGLYIDFNQMPSEKADYMTIVMDNQKTPPEIESLFVEFLKRKKNGDTFTWKWDGERLLWYANQYLDKANQLQSQIFDTTFQSQISAMYNQAAMTYVVGKEKLSKKG
jgi:hypothetical protein